MINLQSIQTTRIMKILKNIYQKKSNKISSLFLILFMRKRARFWLKNTKYFSFLFLLLFCLLFVSVLCFCSLSLYVLVNSNDLHSLSSTLLFHLDIETKRERKSRDSSNKRWTFSRRTKRILENAQSIRQTFEQHHNLSNFDEQRSTESSWRRKYNTTDFRWQWWNRSHASEGRKKKTNFKFCSLWLFIHSNQNVFQWKNQNKILHLFFVQNCW